MMSFRKIVRGGTFLYLRLLIGQMIGFVFWVIVSIIGGSEILGIASAISGLAAMLAGIISLGIFTGVRRFMGIGLGSRDINMVSRYFSTAFNYSLATRSLLLALLVALAINNIPLFRLTGEQLIYAGILMFLTLSIAFDTVFIVFAKTEILFIVSLATSILRLILGVALIKADYGWLGVILATCIANTVSLVSMLMYSFKLIKIKPIFDCGAFIETAKAGIAFWLPQVITSIGNWLGVLTVFSKIGAVETGHYYAVFAIVNGVLAIPVSFNALMLPLLSGMKDGRKRLAWKTIKLSLAVSAPATVLAILYSWLPLSILGREYLEAKDIFTVLALGILPVAFSSGISTLVYAYGIYMYVFLIGVFQNIPRIILYYQFTPILKGLGAAISYTIGSLSGLIASIMIAHKVGFKANFRELLVIIATPTILGLIFSLINVHWVISVSAILVATVLVYTRTNVISKSELSDIVLAFIPREVLRRIYPKVEWMLSILYPE